jgi:hypothetical protein
MGQDVALNPPLVCRARLSLAWNPEQIESRPAQATNATPSVQIRILLRPRALGRLAKAGARQASRLTILFGYCALF